MDHGFFEILEILSYYIFGKMDSTLQTLTSCEKLSLSTNMITGIQNLNNMKSLKILSLGRNLIKNLAGLTINDQSRTLCILISSDH